MYEYGGEVNKSSEFAKKKQQKNTPPLTQHQTSVFFFNWVLVMFLFKN